MTYKREIPRDLFNEANLLKCLGQLALIAHDTNRAGFRLTHREGGFIICQDPADGAIYCPTVHIFIGQEPFIHRRPLNSREPWPLYVEPLAMSGLGDETEVFDDEGNLSPDFRKLIEERR